MTEPAGAAVEPLVWLQDAVVGYDERPVLHGVDFALHPGEAVALLGPNGAGKSTLIRGVLGLADVLGGSVRLFGVPRSRFRDWHRLGYVPQSHTVAGSIPATVREVVASGRLHRHGLWRPRSGADRLAVGRAIETVGLAGRASAVVRTLSGGQQRRVLIARALAGAPDVLVLDEPTAGIDAASRRQLADTLARLLDGGLTLLLVTHELGEVESLITRVVVVEDGRIGYDGAVPAGSPTAFGDRPEPGCEHLHPHGHPGPWSGLRISTGGQAER